MLLILVYLVKLLLICLLCVLVLCASVWTVVSATGLSVLLIGLPRVPGYPTGTWRVPG